MVEEHVIDLIPGYAVGSATIEEHEQVEAHLTHCVLCREELDSYTQVMESLPLAVKTFEPPLDLKQRLISRIREESLPETQTNLVSLWDSIRKTFNRNVHVWGAASLVLVVVLFVSNFVLWERVRSVESVSQSALVTVKLQGTDFKPDATGMLVLSRDGDNGILIVDGLPQLSEAEQYQLWLIQDGERTSGGVFSVNTEGYGNLLVASSSPLSDYNAFGITVEPKGGSPGPTGIKVMGG